MLTSAQLQHCLMKMARHNALFESLVHLPSKHSALLYLCNAASQMSSSVLESDFPMPVKPRKGLPFLDEEEEEEVYCAAPFNMNADIEAPSFTEPGEEPGTLP